MALRRHLVAGDEVEFPDGEKTGTVIVTMITGGCRRLEGIVILHLPDVVDAEVETVGIAGTAGEAGEGRETQDLVVRHAETLDTIKCPMITREGGYCVGCSRRVDYTTVFDL